MADHDSSKRPQITVDLKHRSTIKAETMVYCMALDKEGRTLLAVRAERVLTLDDQIDELKQAAVDE